MPSAVDTRRTEGASDAPPGHDTAHNAPVPKAGPCRRSSSPRDPRASAFDACPLRCSCPKACDRFLNREHFALERAHPTVAASSAYSYRALDRVAKTVGPREELANGVGLGHVSIVATESAAAQPGRGHSLSPGFLLELPECRSGDNFRGHPPIRRSMNTKLPPDRIHRPLPIATFELAPDYHVIELPDAPDGTAFELHVVRVRGALVGVWVDQDGGRLATFVAAQC
jgi:hypothetical protein